MICSNCKRESFRWDGSCPFCNQRFFKRRIRKKSIDDSITRDELDSSKDFSSKISSLKKIDKNPYRKSRKKISRKKDKFSSLIDILWLIGIFIVILIIIATCQNSETNKSNYDEKFEPAPQISKVIPTKVPPPTPASSKYSSKLETPTLTPSIPSKRTAMVNSFHTFEINGLTFSAVINVLEKDLGLDREKLIKLSIEEPEKFSLLLQQIVLPTLTPTPTVTSTSIPSIPKSFPTFTKEIESEIISEYDSTPDINLSLETSCLSDHIVEKTGGMNLIEAKNYTLELINKSRLEQGLNELILGTNEAAQIHSNDAVRNEYVSHWMLNGEKPYQLYSRTGGNSIVSENVYGWEWWGGYELECSEIKYEIEEQHIEMMNSPGHKENLLDPSHIKVNIGISQKPDHGSIVTQFEGGHFIAEKLSLEKGILDFTIRRITTEYQLSMDDYIYLKYDPLPTNLTNEYGRHPERCNSYSVGGGYDCKLRRIHAEEVYDDVFDVVFIETGNFRNDLLSSTLNLNKLAYPVSEIGGAYTYPLRPGVYTLIVYGRHTDTGRIDRLIELSVFYE